MMYKCVQMIKTNYVHTYIYVHITINDVYNLNIEILNSVTRMSKSSFRKKTFYQKKMVKMNNVTLL